MILGYSLSVPDNDHYMLENIVLSPCAKYKNVYDLNIIDPNFIIRKPVPNISYTYDGFLIVSGLFKKFCEDEKYIGIEFIKLPLSINFYWFKIQNILEFDSDVRKTKFLKYDAACDGYEEIIGATPVCLKKHIEIEDGFFRTDICFGSYAKKSPVELIGKSTKKKLEDSGFKEIYFKEILDKYEWQKKV